MADVENGVLLVIAHPDDEVFVSGTLCLCHERGFKTSIVCVTGGEGGQHPFLNSEERERVLRQIRRRELELSALSLGVDQVEMLEFPNAGWEDLNDRPQWDEDRLVEILTNAIERYSPELILTHGPGGGYGHPEHKHVFAGVMLAARNAGFKHSVFSFCAHVGRGGYFSQYFDQPSDVEIDTRTFNRRRVASLCYHQSQLSWFLRQPTRVTSRRFAAAAFGRMFSFLPIGRRRVAFATPNQFMEKMSREGLALQRGPMNGEEHFFNRNFAGDSRVNIK